MTLPAIRQIDAFPIEHEGRQFICLRDTEGIVQEQLLLTPLAFFIACQLNGQNDVSDIQHAFARQFSGQILRSADVQEVVEMLDKGGFLQSEQFFAMRQRVEDVFTASTTRPAYLAGTSYPEHPEQLGVFLDTFFTRQDGPGARPNATQQHDRPARCLIVPHIDFHRGGHAYAHGYLEFFKRGRPQTVFIFGVAHASPPVPFILTRKNYDTPFGMLKTDQNIVQRLENACDWDPYAHEQVHRTEHSIEFQAVMLAYLYGPDVRIVPILCGLFGPELAPGTAIAENVDAFLSACRDIIISASEQVCVIAGADLAHVGRRFGDAFDISETIISTVATRDREDLQHVVAGNADRFYQSVMKDRNQRRVCGLNCIYAALKSLDGMVQSGQLLHYDYAHDPAGGIVSFANVLFT
ncbi:MAG: AmmeMemoRadiSam system protein B [bacterium]|nr:AmmeMemoRadiSam system protein B [bacterium]